MTTIKLICVFVSAVFLVPNPVYAGDSDGSNTRTYSFSVSPVISVLYGQSEEIVYKNKNTSLYESELLWDIKPLLYAGLGADIGPVDIFRNHGFISSAFFRYGLPLRTGSMEDWDWLDRNQYHRTHFSKHDIYSESAILADLSAGFSFRLTGFLAIGVIGEFSFMHFYWSARNGFVQYPEYSPSGDYSAWDSDIPKTYLNGEVITYAQNWFILSPGLSLKARLSRYFSIEGIFNYSPLIYCEDKDNHIVGQTVFLDYLYFGHYLKGGGGFIFSPRHNMDLCLSLSYVSITGARGDTYMNRVKHAGIAGAGYSAFDLGLAVKFSFNGDRR